MRGRQAHWWRAENPRKVYPEAIAILVLVAGAWAGAFFAFF